MLSGRVISVPPSINMEANQLVLPLLVSVRGKIFIDLNTKLFVHEYVSNAN